MTIKTLESNEFDEYYRRYINKVEGELLDGLQSEFDKVFEFVKAIPKEKFHYAYGQGKWTIAQLIQHCIDTERVFQYRAMTIARGDRQNINGFDENEYADALPSSLIDFDQQLSEMKCLRMSTLTMFKGIPNNALSIIGSANGTSLSPRATGFIILGHWMHHIEILKERYLD